jgi:hypothetical protein
MNPTEERQHITCTICRQVETFSVGTGHCDRCHELFRRIQDAPALARLILNGLPCGMGGKDLEPAQQPALDPPVVACPSCFNEYSRHDNPEEYWRVSRVLSQAGALAPAEPSQQEPSRPQPARTLAPTWEEVCNWIRMGAPGRALEVAEKAMHAHIGIAEAEGVIRAQLEGNPVFRHTVFAVIEPVIAEFEKLRHREPGVQVGPMSTSERECLATAILNALFQTRL